MERTRQLRLELLLIRIRRGDEAAFTELVQEWEQPLLFYLKRILPTEDDAWDVLQETWIKAIRSLGSMRDFRAFPAWIYRVARNSAMSRFRAHRPTEALPDEDIISVEQPQPEFTPEEFREVHQALEKLPVVHREAIVLHFLDDLNIAEIATLLGVPPGTVKSRIHHGKTRIRQIIKNERINHESN